ncbi:MAG: hypothetical protein RLZ98_3613, partial [Pseudomonadota bacterium]
ILGSRGNDTWLAAMKSRVTPRQHLSLRRRHIRPRRDDAGRARWGNISSRTAAELTATRPGRCRLHRPRRLHRRRQLLRSNEFRLHCWTCRLWRGIGVPRNVHLRTRHRPWLRPLRRGSALGRRSWSAAAPAASLSAPFLPTFAPLFPTVVLLLRKLEHLRAFWLRRTRRYSDRPGHSHDQRDRNQCSETYHRGHPVV